MEHVKEGPLAKLVDKLDPQLDERKPAHIYDWMGILCRFFRTIFLASTLWYSESDMSVLLSLYLEDHLIFHSKK